MLYEDKKKNSMWYKRIAPYENDKMDEAAWKGMIDSVNQCYGKNPNLHTGFSSFDTSFANWTWAKTLDGAVLAILKPLFSIGIILVSKFLIRTPRLMLVSTLFLAQ